MQTAFAENRDGLRDIKLNLLWRGATHSTPEPRGDARPSVSCLGRSLVPLCWEFSVYSCQICVVLSY